MMDVLNHDDAAGIVASYKNAVATGRADQVVISTDVAAVLGQKLRATTARCGYDLRRCHESRYDELHAEDDRAEAGLRILEAVPALKAAIEDLPEINVADIWAEHGPPVDEDDEDEDEDA